MDERRARELLAEERRRVEAKLTELRGRFSQAEREALGDLADYDQYFAEEATEQYEREVDEGRLLELEEELAAIERAERRLEEGTYGISVESGRPIPDERLELIPYAERTADEEREYRRLTRAPPPRGDEADEDVRTPLDEDAPPPPDLADIPLAIVPADREYDPQEDSDEIDPDALPGAVYATESAAPAVGEPEPGDRLVERAYRPDARPPLSVRRRRAAVRLLVDAGRLEPVPRGTAAETADLLGRARRHLESADRTAATDPDGALTEGWLGSRHALLALMVDDGLRFADTTSWTVSAYATAALPDIAGIAAAELEEAQELVAARGRPVTERALREGLRRARRVIAVTEDQLSADERLARL